MPHAKVKAKEMLYYDNRIREAGEEFENTLGLKADDEDKTAPFSPVEAPEPKAGKKGSKDSDLA